MSLVDVNQSVFVCVCCSTSVQERLRRETLMESFLLNQVSSVKCQQKCLNKPLLLHFFYFTPSLLCSFFTSTSSSSLLLHFFYLTPSSLLLLLHFFFFASSQTSGRHPGTQRPGEGVHPVPQPSHPRPAPPAICLHCWYSTSISTTDTFTYTTSANTSTCLPLHRKCDS